MAFYSGIYHSDLIGRSWSNYFLEAYFISNDIKVPTSYETDQDYLPPIFLSNVTNERGICGLRDGITNRFAVVTISESLAFWVTCPFRGGSGDFMEFFRYLSGINSSYIITLKPERIPPYLVSLWV